MQLAGRFSLDFEFKKANIAIKNPEEIPHQLESADKFGPELINCTLKNFSEK